MNKIISLLLVSTCTCFGTSSASDQNSADEEWCDAAEIAAKEGDADSQAEFAACYLSGVGREENIETAIYWLERSIEGGSTAGMTNLGSAHLFGKIPNPHHTYAVELLQQAASKGNITAEFALSQAYRNGLGVTMDIDASLRHLRTAAESGHSLACFVLFASYEMGLYGLEKNNNSAEIWKSKLLQSIKRQRTPRLQDYVLSVVNSERVQQFVFDQREILLLREYAAELE